MSEEKKIDMGLAPSTKPQLLRYADWWTIAFGILVWCLLLKVISYCSPGLRDMHCVS